MLNLLNKSDEYLKSLVLSKSPGLWTKRREKRLLVVKPDLGTWTILEEQFQEFFKKINKPILYPEFIANNEGIPPAMYIAFMEELFKKGMLLLSGKQIEFPGAKKLKPPISTRLIHLHFKEGKTKSFDFFHNFIKERFKIEEYEKYNVYLYGNISPLDSELPEFLSSILCDAKDYNKHVDFSIESPDNKTDIPDFMKDIPLTIEFTEIIKPGVFKDEIKREELEKNLQAIGKIQDMGIKAAVKAALYEPEDISPLMDILFKNNIVNIAMKIAPEVYMNDIPLVKNIRRMESFAKEYLKILDSIEPEILYNRKKLVLHDVHRFLARLTGFDTPFPCGISPCGMGEQLIVVDDSGKIFACRSTNKTNEKLILKNEDINYPGKSEKLSFWKSDRLENSSHCKRCAWRYLCGGGCPVITMEKYGDINREDPRCRFFRLMYENLLWKYYDSPLMVRKLGGLT